MVVRKIAAQRVSGYAEQMPRAANEQFSMELKLLSVAFEDVGDGFVANQILLNEELFAVFKFFFGAVEGVLEFAIVGISFEEVIGLLTDETVESVFGEMSVRLDVAHVIGNEVVEFGFGKETLLDVLGGFLELSCGMIALNGRIFEGGFQLRAERDFRLFGTVGAEDFLCNFHCFVFFKG